MSDQNPIPLLLDASEAINAMSELEMHLPGASLELREEIRSLFDFPAELLRIEQAPASVGAGVSCLLKPTDRFLDLLAACRAFNL